MDTQDRNIKIYKERENQIKTLERLQRVSAEMILEDSELKIGDKVQRVRDVEDGNDVVYYISSMVFDTEDYMITYGIKSDMSARIDTYSCIWAENLRKVI